MNRCSFVRTCGVRYLSCCLAALFLLLTSRSALAADPERVEWSADWPRFRKAEIALTSGMALQMAAATFVYPEARIRWEGGILFDDAVRNALVLGSRSSRDQSATWSDNIYYVLAAYPFVVDTAIVTAGIHGAGDVAVQMLAINLEAYAFAGAVALGAEKVGRARPMTPECRKDPSYSDKCDNEAALASSFLSGHTVVAFASAGLTCAHHQHLPLYGGGVPDLAACLVMLSAATAAGTMRVTSDNHYASDVLLGAGIGFFGGYVMPSVLHYGFTSGGTPKNAGFLPTFSGGPGGSSWAAVLAPAIDSEQLGVALSGVF
ncbi:MAG TPA: phosphatase PAP2 family protein [Polyangiaceae bacterium]|nr:phosphatase PAP2 family protein [Polyangiaceae bacterium]